MKVRPSIILESFAGLGGAGIGIKRALGRSADVAINHWDVALGVHAANHPTTRHLVEDVWRVSPAMLGAPIDFAWFSPDCRHHSNAKGGELRDAKIRGLSWSLVRLAASPIAPRVWVLENVRELLTWGPLHRTHSNGCPYERGVRCPSAGKGCHFSTPIASRAGETWRAFVRRLQRLGYVVDWEVFNAADFGAATNRRRLIVVGRRDGKLPRLPIADTRRQPRPASSVIDWSIPLPSIFDRDVPYSPPTLARIVEGWRRYGRTASAYMIHRSNGERVGQSPRVYSLDAPLGTIVAQGVKHALVVPFVVKHFSARGDGSNTCASLDMPIGAITTKDHHAIAACYTGDRRDHRAEVAALLGPEAVALGVVDIGMRYLVPRELATAQGLPTSYVIDRTASGEHVPPTTQVKLIGNSVSPPLAEAVVRTLMEAA
jgi:DNA (cytosine-5)-methyltransferase 1